MLKTIFPLALIFVFLASLACFADTGIPDPYLSEAVCAYDGPGVPSLLVVPDGSGPAFTAAHDEDGNVVDATVTLYLRDFQGIPFPNFPREDMWLEAVDGGLASCQWGVLADEDTDHNGMTWWILPAVAGGFSESNVRVMVNGSPLFTGNIILRFNSPDLTGDLIVNLADVATFAGDYFGGYQFRSDLHRDGNLNLSDIVVLAQNFGAQCP